MSCHAVFPRSFIHFPFLFRSKRSLLDEGKWLLCWSCVTLFNLRMRLLHSSRYEGCSHIAGARSLNPSLHSRRHWDQLVPSDPNGCRNTLWTHEESNWVTTLSDAGGIATSSITTTWKMSSLRGEKIYKSQRLNKLHFVFTIRNTFCYRIL